MRNNGMAIPISNDHACNLDKPHFTPIRLKRLDGDERASDESSLPDVASIELLQNHLICLQ